MIRTSSLTSSEIRRIEDLIARLKAKQVSLEEAKQNQETLEQRKLEAFDKGEVLLGLALVLLGAALVIYLAQWLDSY